MFNFPDLQKELVKLTQLTAAIEKLTKETKKLNALLVVLNGYPPGTDPEKLKFTPHSGIAELVKALEKLNRENK